MSRAELTPSYSYPEQPSKNEILKNDPQCTLLTDGKVGLTGPQSIWGKWGQKELIVDWTFPEAVRITRMRIAIIHTQADSPNSHISKIKFYGSDDEAAFTSTPDVIKEIPFEEGRLQKVEIVFNENELIAKKLRTVFVSARQQVVISEVSFEWSSATDELLQQTQKQRLASESMPLKKIDIAPPPLSDSAKVTADTIFGISGHMLHTNFFIGQFSPYWDLSYTLPLLVNANISWVREPLYQNLFATSSGKEAKDAETIKRNRKKVEVFLAQYQARNIKVILCPSLHTDAEGFEDYAKWLATLSLRFSCVKALEMHNEPNLRGFWKKSIGDYVESVKQFAAIAKSINPKIPIVVGSFSGWGGAWQHEDLRALISGPKDLATRWAEEAFKLGLLNYADAVSAHPYRGKSAPEGGDVLAERDDPEGFAKEIQYWRELVKKYAPQNKPELPLYITEIGYSVSTTGYTNVDTESRQAEYLSRLMLLMFELRLRDVPIQTVCWYDLKQDETHDVYEHNFGIVSTDTSELRPAYQAFQRLARFFDNTTNFQLVDIKPTSVNGAECVKTIVLRRLSDNALILVYWRLNQLQKKDVNFPTSFQFELPAKFTPSQATLYASNENQPRSIGYILSQNTVTLSTSATAGASWIVLQ